MIKKGFVLLYLFLIVIIIFAGCQTKEESAYSERKGGTLRYGLLGDPISFDPAKEVDVNSQYISGNIFETLVKFKPGTTEIIPCLAKSWNISADNLEYTFNLRRDVFFHDGTPMDADSVIFSFMRQYDKKHPYYRPGAWKYWSAMDMNRLIKKIEKIDSYTVRISLNEPEAPFIANLAMNFTAIVSPSSLEKYGDEFGEYPVGTGAFIFDHWEKGIKVVLKRNENYWGNKAYLDQVHFIIIKDSREHYRKLKQGELDIISTIQPEDLDKMMNDADLKYIEQAGLNTGFIAFNTQKKPFDNKLVRLALNYAVDKNTIVKEINGKLSVIAKNPIPPIMWSYDDDIKPYPYDPEKAKSLLAEAGYPNGFTSRLWPLPIVAQHTAKPQEMALMFKKYFEAVGVKIIIENMDIKTILQRTSRGEHDMTFYGWGSDNGDPDSFFWLLLSAPAAEIPATNTAFWKNKKFTELVQKAKTNSDIKYRTELYRQAQVIFHEEMPWIPIAHGINIIIMRKQVRDFILDPIAIRDFNEVWLSDEK